MSRIPTRPVQKYKKLFTGLVLFSLAAFVALGVMAKNVWLPSTDPVTGKQTGWFGQPVLSSGFSRPQPLPSGTPQLSKEYIYAGGRLLAVEDANANAAPPADLAVWRPGNGYWYVLGGAGSQQFWTNWGSNGDTPVPGDFDGDGKTDLSVFRPSNGNWYILYSSNNNYDTVQWASSGDEPVPADFDGDGKTDIAVYRSSNGHWYILKSSDLNVWDISWGGVNGDDHKYCADYDGDGRADVTIWRPSNHTFYVLTSTSNYSSYMTQSIGSTGDTPVPADYDGDGKANYAVRSGASWIILNAAGTSSTTTTPSGDLATDIPVQNDYDGDGIVDIAVWRAIASSSPGGDVGNWYIRKSTGGTRTEQWGATGDVPVPAYFRR